MKKSMKRRLILGGGVQFDKLNFFSEDTDWSVLEHELNSRTGFLNLDHWILSRCLTSFWKFVQQFL